MSRAARHLLALFAVGAVGACGSSPSIRLCPCEEGFVCCEVDRVCVRDQAQCTPPRPSADAAVAEDDASAPPTDASVADAGGPAPDAAVPAPDAARTPPADDQDEDGYRAISFGGDDCDDNDPDIHPGALEVPYDGIDQDCVGGDLIDVDGDGYPGFGGGGADCDDTNAEIYGTSTAEHASGDIFVFCRDQLIATWMAAEASCNQLGGHLVSIEDEATNVFVATHAKNLLGPLSGWWIGLNDRETSTVFEWTDGRPVTYTHWAATNPNHSPGEDCVVMYDSNGGTNTWGDQPCDYRQSPTSRGFGYACRLPRESRWTVLLEEDFDDGSANGWFLTPSGCAVSACPIVHEQRLAMPAAWNRIVAPVTLPATARQVALSFTLERSPSFGVYGGFGVVIVQSVDGCAELSSSVAGELGAEACVGAGTEVQVVSGLEQAGTDLWRIEKTLATERCEVWRGQARVAEVACGDWASHAGYGGVLFEVRSAGVGVQAGSAVDDVRVEYR